MSGMKHRALAEAERYRQAATLGEVADRGVDIFCWCNRCGHNAVVASASLIATLGEGYPVPDIGVRMHCTRCNGKDVATRPDWPSLGQVARHG